MRERSPRCSRGRVRQLSSIAGVGDEASGARSSRAAGRHSDNAGVPEAPVCAAGRPAAL
ncbi:uncharacterized protein TRAVEDRAFT_26191, partial [Trametes versicolor FP-101664 SS1]|uniref:uncharacterized protein n=1 Tax=Trametes versicolor (strain FP-101664) TaxID=717944 RepID=UPI0004624061